MEPFFELSKATDGQFRFVLKGDNAKVLLSSELYRVKESAHSGIVSVQKNCGSDGRIEKKVAANGKFFFNLKAANNQVIGTSQLYATEQERDTALAAVKAGGATLTVRENT